MKRAWLLAAIVAAGCGRTGSDDPGTAPDSNPQVPVDEPGAPGGGTDPQGATGPCGGRITLRLSGTNAEPGAELALAVSGATAIGPGGALRASTSPGTARFPVSGAYRIAVLDRPAVDGAVHATIHLSGAERCEGGGCAALDACGSPLELELDPARVSPDRCHVVVQLDLAASVQRTAGGAVFLPRYSVHY